ncbi:hypothetical protein ACFV0L_36550 [Streptosporangium canum]|uniref:hypothetical protein n=1 Tax=Streptosporangium canum TaxID=324952 RepID=UPI0036CCE3F3
MSGGLRREISPLVFVAPHVVCAIPVGLVSGDRRLVVLAVLPAGFIAGALAMAIRCCRPPDPEDSPHGDLRGSRAGRIIGSWLG